MCCRQQQLRRTGAAAAGSYPMPKHTTLHLPVADRGGRLREASTGVHHLLHGLHASEPPVQDAVKKVAHTVASMRLLQPLGFCAHLPDILSAKCADAQALQKHTRCRNREELSTPMDVCAIVPSSVQNDSKVKPRAQLKQSRLALHLCPQVRPGPAARPAGPSSSGCCHEPSPGRKGTGLRQSCSGWGSCPVVDTARHSSITR